MPKSNWISKATLYQVAQQNSKVGILAVLIHDAITCTKLLAIDIWKVKYGLADQLSEIPKFEFPNQLQLPCEQLMQS
ncbi:MAG TPA: hypothetical protein VFE02_06300 [Candidatus Acidoferrales bacterium]|jgi:hypothetical protein|nr:hypothetical protein [Candidatus Acidoferrales bacterium]